MTTKILVSLPQEFLDEVDQLAAEEHRSRSELIREALRAYLEARQARKLQLKRIAEQPTPQTNLSAE
jgi:CopG family transcriptional regulator/antitoxin EndoAI